MTSLDHQWDIAAAPVGDETSVRLLRTYTDEMASRYYGRPATPSEVDSAMAEDPSDDLTPPNGVFLVARRDGEAVGCVAMRLLSAEIGEIKRMYVAREVRGLGCGGRLLAAVEAHARALGAHRLRLDTRHDLVEARALYARHGYTEIPPYAERLYADHWFEKILPEG